MMHSDSSSSVERFLTMMPFYSDLLSSVEHSSLLIRPMIPFDSSLSVEHTCNQYFLTNNSFNLLSSVEKTCEVGICFVAVISIITG